MKESSRLLRESTSALAQETWRIDAESFVRDCAEKIMTIHIKRGNRERPSNVILAILVEVSKRRDNPHLEYGHLFPFIRGALVLGSHQYFVVTEGSQEAPQETFNLAENAETATHLHQSPLIIRLFIEKNAHFA